MNAWIDPLEWSEYRRIRRDMRVASVLMAIAIVGSIPAIWIVLVPADPTLRPDLTTTWAWIALALCALFATSGHTIARRTRERFDRLVYRAAAGTREQAAVLGVPLEVDLGEAYPPVLVSRQHRIIGVVGPEPLIISMDRITVDISPGGNGGPSQPHIVLKIAAMDPAEVYIVAGRGLGRANMDQTHVLMERLKDFFDPGVGWETKVENPIDVAAFIESMRPR